MNFMIRSSWLLTPLLMLSAVACFASGVGGNNFNLTEVAPGIHVHSGVHVEFEHPQHDDIANTGFIIGDDCVAVIDTGGSTAIARQLQAALRTITDKPVCYVINTHVHFDHVLGNAVFKTGETRFVGHADLADAMHASREFFVREFGDDLGEFANPEGIVIPDLAVEDTLELDLGNRVLRLRAWPAAHSHTDISIVDTTTGTLWLSDLLFIERIPALDGSLKGWLQVIDQLAAQAFSTVIPGHGPVSRDWPGAMQAQKQYLEMLLQETRRMIAEGAFMENVVESVGAQEKLDWLLYEQHHKRNVTKAFTELEWE